MQTAGCTTVRTGVGAFAGGWCAIAGSTFASPCITVNPQTTTLIGAAFDADDFGLAAAGDGCGMAAKLFSCAVNRCA